MSGPFLCFNTSDENLIDLASSYWDGCHIDGKWTWDYSVKEVAEDFGISQYDVLRCLKDNVTAFDLDSRCSLCAKPRELTSRTALASSLLFQCGSCVAAETQKRMAAESKSRSELEVTKAAKIKELSTRFKTFEYDTISILDAAFLYSIFIASDRFVETGWFSNSDNFHLCPTSILSGKVIGRLFNRGIIQFHEATNVKAISEITEDGRASYLPHSAVWKIVPDGKGRSTGAIMEMLGVKIDDACLAAPDYTEAVARLWWTLAYDDVSEFLANEVDEFRLPEPVHGEKTKQALTHALSRFSIPRVRRAIRSVVKDAAAYSVRRNLYGRQALNTIPGAPMRFIDRATDDGWELYPITRDWINEEPVLYTVLFNRLLKSGTTGFRQGTGSSYDQLIGFDL